MLLSVVLFLFLLIYSPSISVFIPFLFIPPLHSFPAPFLVFLVLGVPFPNVLHLLFLIFLFPFSGYCIDFPEHSKIASVIARTKRLKLGSKNSKCTKWKSPTAPTVIRLGTNIEVNKNKAIMTEEVQAAFP